MAGYRKADVTASEKGMERIKGGIPFWKPPAGAGDKFKTSLVRILPPRDDHPDDSYFFWVALHGNLPGAGRPIVCPKKMNDEPCAACDAGNALWNAGRKQDAYQFFSSWRACVNIVVLNPDGSVPEDAVIIPWAISKDTFTSLDGKLSDRPKAQRDITDVEHGYNIKLKRKGTSAQDTKYEIDAADNPSPVAPEILAMMDEDEDHQCELWPLDRLYPRTEPARIVALLTVPNRPAITAGAYADEDDEEDDVVEGSFTTVEDDDEEEDAVVHPFDVDEDEEEDDVVVTPVTTRKSKVSGPTAAVTEARDRLAAALAEVN